MLFTPSAQKARHGSSARGLIVAFLLLVVLFVGSFVAGRLSLQAIRDQYDALRALGQATTLAADIARNTTALRQAARDHMTGQTVTSDEVLKRTDDLIRQITDAQTSMGPEERDMLAGVPERLSRLREGFGRIVALEQLRDTSRAELLATLGDLQRETAARVVELGPGEAAPRLLRSSYEIADRVHTVLSGAMESKSVAAIAAPLAEAATHPTLAIIVARIANAHRAHEALLRDIAGLDSRFLGTEGRLIVRTTELLRDQAAREEQALADQESALMTRIGRVSLIFFAACVLIVAAGLLLILTRYIRPLAHLSRLLLQVSETGQPVRVPYQQRGDEVGAIGRAVAAFGRLIESRNEAERDLAAARDAAEAATRAKGDFLAVMSHEIRTPMSGVIGMIEILEQSRLDADQASCVQVVRESAVSLLRIINDILDFSRLDAAKLEIEMIPLSPELSIEAAADSLAPAARSKGIGLHVFVDPAIPAFVIGDPVRLRQIIVNLAGNAVKFTERGGVSIRLLLLSAADARARVRLEVDDTGIGIPADKLASLFRPFAQADASTGRRFGGSGLGLSITQRLVELMGGEIAVASIPDKGSRFSVTMELAIADLPPGAPAMRIDLTGLAVKVELTDAVMCRDLEAYVTAAGATAVHQATAQAPDVIVRAERAEPDPGVPVVLLTEHGKHRLYRHARCVPVGVPVRRMGLLRGVAIAGNRMSPDVPAVDFGAAEDAAAPIVPGIAEAEAAGRLILVVDDHPTNRTVLLRQLNLLGFAGEAVEDGIEALDALTARRYAVMLTDCHMPNLDGFELTAAIRAAEAEPGNERHGQHLPIIAVTANALIGEAEQCLAAGMDFYLSKPVALTRLREALRRFLPARPELIEIATAVPIAEASAAPIDLAALAELFGDEGMLLHGLLEEFLNSARVTAAAIETALGARSDGELKAAGHKLHGAARSAGAVELAEIARRIEQAAMAKDWTVLDDACVRLQPAMQRAEAFVASIQADVTSGV
jgi:signal transduction histidine kinase/CheY-like chemotaxis protein/HPt (histidine-containing phosphotransfer) domain-containing protein